LAEEISILSFRLLGPVALFKDGKPLEQFRSQKEAALLIYLAHTGKSHPRDFLAELLWEERTISQMRGNLRTVLSRLRQQVDDALVVTRSSVGLAEESRHQVDSVRLLQALINFGPISSPEKATALQCLLEGYPGDFLADFFLSDAPLFDSWATATREEIRTQVIVAFRKLAGYILGGGETTQGIAIARRWLGVDELDEDAHILLIRLLLQQGDRPAAVAHYRAAVHLLRSELDVEPSPALSGLIQPTQPTLFPPARHLRPAPHNLPPTYNPFFGRVRVQQEIHSRLDQPWCRLVTIVGQGGVGKTRLAVTVARNRLEHYADGVWLVELAEIDPADEDLSEAIATEIATAIDLRFSGSAKPTEQLQSHLEHKQTLLVLDNFEHILDGVPIVLDILQRCEGMQILATSREPLRVRAEWVIDLAGLDYPGDNGDETDSEAVELYLARRTQQQRGPISPENLAAARTICRMVQGLPLAIELAAALTRDTSSQAIARQLSHDFDRLTASQRDVPERHSSLHIVFEMSWRTLSPELQARLARLAIFRGGFAPEAAAQIAQASTRHLAALQEKSLLAYQSEAGRYALHPIVRAYAEAKRPPDDPTPGRHAEYFVARLAEHAASLLGAAPQESVAAILPDLDNVRLAWQTALAARVTPHFIPALSTLSSVYQLRGLALEGAEMMQATVRAASEWKGTGVRLATRASLEQARFQNRLGRHRPAIETAQRALTLAETSDDRWAEGMGHILLGESLWRLGEYDTARQKLVHALTLAQSLASNTTGDAGVTLLIGWSHHHLGIIDDIQARYDDALPHLEQACDAWRAIDHAQALSNSLNSIGIVHYHSGDLPEAQAAMEQAVTLCNRIDNRHLQSLLFNNLSLIATEQRDYRGAHHYLQSGLELAITSGNLAGQAEMYDSLGKNYLQLGENELAIKNLEQGVQIAELVGDRRIRANLLLGLANAKQEQGDAIAAESFLLQALTITRQANLQSIEWEATIGLAELLRSTGAKEAGAYAAQAVELARRLSNPHFLARAQAIAAGYTNR